LDFLLSQEDFPYKDLLFYLKAIILADSQKWQEAKKFIKKALEIENNNLEFKRLLARIEFNT
jgi:hypothetical protein